MKRDSIKLEMEMNKKLYICMAVSYTHRDVYKRQPNEEENGQMPPPSYLELVRKGMVRDCLLYTSRCV